MPPCECCGHRQKIFLMLDPIQIKRAASSIQDDLLRIRQHLHRHPELSYQEFGTQQYVRQEIEKLGIAANPIAGTGLIAEIQGGKPGKTIALRADLDALPIQEVSGRPHGSTNAGVMHACGHDVHTACLLGAMQILHNHRSLLAGTIRFLFQPGEEKLPGGATVMIAEGALEGVEAIIGQHVFPDLEVGLLGIKSGIYMASTDEIYIKVIGKGGHAALPHKLVDPVLISAHLITAFQSLVSRSAPANIPVVLSFGKMIANGATNIIPDQVLIEGTLRTMNESLRMELHDKISTLASGIAMAMGGSVEVDIIKGYPVLQNDPLLTDALEKAACEFWGAEKIKPLDIRMTAEDFAWYAQEVPGCFYRLGTRNQQKGITAGLHTPAFDVDEEALSIGAATLAWLAASALKQ